MTNTSVSFESIKSELLQNSEVKEEYDRLKPRYDIIAQIIAIRKEKNMTQEQLAALVGTKKSNISRLESGAYNPSLDMLIKIAKGLGKELNIQLI